MERLRAHLGEVGLRDHHKLIELTLKKVKPIAVRD
jgi:hypothetical protein